MQRIRDHLKCPPGSYYYRVLFNNGIEQAWFGPCRTTPSCKQFGPSPIIGDVAKGLSAFRLNNNLPRSDYVAALEDVDIYTCQRIGGMKEWCIDTDRSFVESNPAAIPSSSPCATCGHRLE